MGRFKVYDAQILVTILKDTNYAECLICKKKLKNIMGNIKRHYEQIHDTVLDANNGNKKKYSKKKNKTGRNSYDDDEDYVIPKKKKSSKLYWNTVKSELVNGDIEVNKTSKSSSPTTAEIESLPRNRLSEKILTGQGMLPLGLDVYATSATLINKNNIYDQIEQINFNDNKFSNKSPAILEENKINFEIDSAEAEQLANNSTFCSIIKNIQIVSLAMDQDELLKCTVEIKSQLNMFLKDFCEKHAFQTDEQSSTKDLNHKINQKALANCINVMANKLRYEISKEVINRLIYLKLDVASKKERNILLVHVQFIKDFKIQVLTISILELLDNHIASFLKEKVLSVLQRYQIDIGRVFNITKDNANNIIKTPLETLDLTEEEREENVSPTNDYGQYMCEQFPGHALHFVACDVINQLNENISQSRDAVKALRKKMSQFNIKLIPIVDQSTSWCSIYDMIKSLLNIRPYVEHESHLFVDVDWKFATKFAESFKPIVDAVTVLQSNYLIMGDLYREWLVCENELKDLANSNELALYLLEALSRRKSHLLENKHFLAALYLDPRFCYKGSKFLDEKQNKLAINQLLTIFNELKSIQKTINNKMPNDSSNVVDNNVNDRYTNLEKKIAADMGLIEIKIENENTVCLEDVDSHWVEKALQQLQLNKRLPFTANVLDWWKTKSHKYHILAKMAEIALAAPATQVSINKALSVLPITLTSNKLNLSADNVENILLLKLNQDLVNKISLE